MIASWGDRSSIDSLLAAVLLDDTMDSVYIAGVNLYQPLGEFCKSMGHVPGFRMRISNRRRSAILRGVKNVPCISGRFFVDYLAIDSRKGLKGNKETHRRRRLNVINLELFTEPPPLHHSQQMAMAFAILKVCDARKVKFRPTKGGLGSAMLKASPNWEKGRYAAPQFINDAARRVLPGNYYAVSPRVNDRFGVLDHCYYIDQSSAHHNIVNSLLLPDPQAIHARGNFRSAEEGRPQKWLSVDSPTGREVLGSHLGLLLCQMHISTLPPTMSHLYPTWAKQKGQRHIWLWTPEMRLLQGDHRIQLEHIVCGLTSTQTDKVLPEYASFCLDYMRKNPDDKPYIKSTLLSAYGMLAFNSRNHTLYRYWGGASKGHPVELPITGMVKESAIRMPDFAQPSIVNVTARGMIEAETRTRSLEYARELHNQGFEVAQIYADGLLVHTNQLPLIIPDGWRVSHSLTNVSIPRPNAFTSDQLTKLPGHPLSDDDRRWLGQRTMARRPILKCEASHTVAA